MNYLEALNWRYSVKKFNGKKIPTEKLNRILEAGRLSVSSLGMQPYYLIVVENNIVLQELASAFYNTNQISTCSHLIVLVAKKVIDKAYIDNYFDHIQKERNITLEQLDAFRNNIDNFIKNHSKEELTNWTDKQNYIVLGTLITAAAEEYVDTCPMEGFKNKELEALLKINTEQEKISVVLALGYRADDDIFQNFKKVRKPTDKFIKFL